MLREKILRKIYLTTMIVFILFIISSFTINKNISNIKVEYQTKVSKIYLMDDNNYLLAVPVSVKDNLMDSIPIVINSLKQNYNHISGLKGIIPNNTKINSVKLNNGILEIDFNSELLNINSDLEEKIIESIIYSLLEFKEIDKIKITIDNKPLKEVIKSNILVDDILSKDFGINKEYSINGMKDIKRVVLYFYEEKDNNRYYVPVTKYLNSRDDKIKIIIDNLKNNYLVKPNLMSYINDKINIEKYQKEKDIVTISFNSILDFNDANYLEEAIYTISNSIIDSNEASKVIFMQNNQILSIK